MLPLPPINDAPAESFFVRSTSYYNMSETKPAVCNSSSSHSLHGSVCCLLLER